jgi:hypothetical protein
MCRNVSYIQSRTICNEASELETVNRKTNRMLYETSFCITPESSVVILCITGFNIKQDRQCTYYIILRGVSETIIVV